MKQLRSIGIFMIACSAICFIIAIERYASAVATAKHFAELFDGVEYESVSMPIETTVCGLGGVVLLIAGARMLFNSIQKQNNEDGNLLARGD